MVPFKPYFMGLSEPPASRMVTVQKCFRTTDIESVGDYSHLTFFEMMGNFSVGDYFKEGAINFAWELLTQRFRLDANRLWISIFETDDEAHDLWRAVGVPEERIQRYGGGPDAQEVVQDQLGRLRDLMRNQPERLPAPATERTS